MVIQGLKKLTLSDYPGETACTVFTAGCNFRCPSCCRASLVIDTYKNKEIPQQEFFDFLSEQKETLTGVCVTGGEPLIQRGIEDFLREIKQMGYAVKLETNGSFPDKLRKIVEAGLVDYIAMDIKNSQESYGKSVGIEGYDIGNVHKSASYLISGVIPYEFRTTVVRGIHQRADFEAIGRWIRGAKKYYLLQFENTGDLLKPGLRGYNQSIMQQAAEIVGAYVENVSLRLIE